MVSAINQLGTVYSVSVSDIGDKSAGLTKAIANNVNPDISTFHSIFSRQLNAAALRGTHIIENLGIGYNLASTALSTLNSLSEQLDTIRNTIMALDNASPQLLDIEQDNYTSQIGRIFDTLANTDFNGKRLFDGTLANAPVPRLPSQNLPDNTGSLLIETSISSQSYVNITIPRLLSGDGTIVNAPVDGVFDPLFPVTDNTIAALNKLAIVPQTTVNINTIVNPGNIPPNNTWDGINMTGSYGDQIRIIEQALPANVSVEQDIVRDIAIEGFKSTATAFGGSSENNVSAGNYLKYAVAVASTLTLSDDNKQEVEDAKGVIMTVVNAIYATNGSALAERVNLENIPHDPITSYAQQVLRNFVLTYFDLNASSPNGGDRLGPFPNRLNGIIDGTGTRPIVNNILSRSSANPIYIGSIKTLSGRVGAMKIIDNAIRSINTAAAQITGQRDIIETNTGVLKQNIISLIKSADSISSADYEKIVPKLTELLRSVTVLSVAFGLEEDFLETIINRLEFIGNQ